MRTCPNCHNSTDLTYLWDTDIVHCPQCDLAYRDPLPTLDELAQIYSDEAYFNGRFYADYVADKLGAQLNLRHRLNTMSKFQDGGAALFEAGCAHGFFLELAQSSWKRVQGIDMSAEAVAYGRDVLGLDVALGDFESHPPQQGHSTQSSCGIPSNISMIRYWRSAKAQRLYGLGVFWRSQPATLGHGCPAYKRSRGG
jgi:hypothetical protein